MDGRRSVTVAKPGLGFAGSPQLVATVELEVLRFFFAVFFLNLSQLPKEANSMLMVYQVVVLHEFGKVQGLIDLLFADKGFLGPKRSPAALPSENLSCRSQNQTFFRFFLEERKTIACLSRIR